MERNYPVEKKMFDYENYVKLLAAVGAQAKSGDQDAISDVEAIKKVAASFPDYVSVVDSTETQIKIAYARYEGSELRERVENYDTYRRVTHNAAIANVSLLNKLAAWYVGKGTNVFIGDAQDRCQVADFCLDFTVGVFQNRRP